MGQNVVMKIRELAPTQLLSVPCPTCDATKDESCHLSTGTLRNEPHRDRKLAAADSVEAMMSKTR